MLLWVNTEPWFANSFPKHPKKESITEGDGQQKGFPYNDLTVQSTQYYCRSSLSLTNGRCQRERLIAIFPSLILLSSSQLSFSPSLSLYLSAVHAFGEFQEQLCIWKTRPEKRHGIEQKLYPRASTCYKRLHQIIETSSLRWLRITLLLVA